MERTAWLESILRISGLISRKWIMRLLKRSATSYQAIRIVRPMRVQLPKLWALKLQSRSCLTLRLLLS